MIGTIGQLLILIGFVACGLAGVSYFRAAQRPTDPTDWRRIGRGAWFVMTGVLTAAFVLLAYLVATHQFQYAYVFQHSSRDLPARYLFSATWAGQEGSFLLWILFNGFLGLALLRWIDREYLAPVLSIVAFCQLFLLTMIVGLKLGPLSIGSSPFTTLPDAFPDAPIFQANPNFVPADGQGLNDLLQNPWMVIHPPTLFVGFTTMIVPFAFAVTALWKKRYTEWVRPAMPWTLVSVAILGLGITMGGYWAYVTLSFGGYWAWDPVENSSLVPWIIGAAAFHAMLIQRKSGLGHKSALFLSILAYIFVIYSTFLTRSGILGNVSVHSFVDLGLHNQLLIWILAMGVVGFGLFIARYRELPKPTREPYYLSREFMIFSGAMLLCAVAAVVILGTSAPIFGRIFRDNPAAVPIEFYNKWTLPLAVGFVFLAGMGQLFWWTKMSVENINRVLLKPMALSVASTIAVLLFTPFVEKTARPPVLTEPAMVQAGLVDFWSVYGQGLLMLMLLFGAFFALFGNGIVLWRVARGNPRLAGGATAHVGFALLILGVIASSGFSNPLAEPGRENFIVERDRPVQVEGYTVRYVAQETTEQGRPRYVLEFDDGQGRAFTVRPVAYKSNKDQWIQHPDLKMYFEKDIFVAVSPDAMFGEQVNSNEITLQRGQATLLGDNAFQIVFREFVSDQALMADPEAREIPVTAVLEVTNVQTGETRTMRPVYILDKAAGAARYEPAAEDDWGLVLTFTRMNVNNGEIHLHVDGVQVMPEDWLVVQAYEKPFINVLWIGFIVMTIGFGLAAVRRGQDALFSRRRAAI